MDSKRSSVKEASNREYRATLPRGTDACHEVMQIMDMAQPEDHIQMMVLDAQEAFWNVPSVTRSDVSTAAA